MDALVDIKDVSSCSSQVGWPPQVPTPSTKPHFLSPHFRVLVQDTTPLKHQPYFPSVRFPIAVPAGWPLTLSFFFPFPPKTHLSRGCCHSFLLGNERVGAALEAICHQGGLIGAQSWATPASQVGISWSSSWPDGMSALIRRTWYPWHLKKKEKKTPDIHTCLRHLTQALSTKCLVRTGRRPDEDEDLEEDEMPRWCCHWSSDQCDSCHWKRLCWGPATTADQQVFFSSQQTTVERLFFLLGSDAAAKSNSPPDMWGEWKAPLQRFATSEAAWSHTSCRDYTTH